MASENLRYYYGKLWVNKSPLEMTAHFHVIVLHGANRQPEFLMAALCFN